MKKGHLMFAISVGIAVVPFEGPHGDIVVVVECSVPFVAVSLHKTPTSPKTGAVKNGAAMRGACRYRNI